MQFRLLPLLAIASLFVHIATVQAEPLEIASDTEEDEQEIDITVTGELLNQPLYAPFRREGTVRESTRPAYVINREQVEAQGARTVDEALRYLPGIISEGTAGGQLGSLSGQFMRGANTGQVLVLLDGRPLNDVGFFGGFDLSQFSTDIIEQIEVVPGGGSTLYGSDAIGGVINIITRLPKEEGNKILPSLGFGSFGEDRQTIQMIGRSGSWGWVLGYNRIDSESDFPFEINDGQFSFEDSTADDVSFDIDDRRDNADVLYNNASAKIIADLSDRHRLTFSALYLDKDFGVSSGVPIPVSGSLGEFNSLTPNARQNTREWLLDLTWEFNMGNSDDSILTAKTSFDSRNYDFEDPDPSGSRDKVDRTGIGFQLQHNWQLAKNQRLNYGFDYRSVDAENRTSQAGEPEVENYDGNISQGALFARYQFDFSPNLSAHVGVRQDFSSTASGGVTSPSVGARWGITGTTTLRANYGRSFRAPLLSNLEGLAAFNVEGNSDLEAERGDSFDVGIDQQLGDRGLLRLTYFINDVDDLINFEFGSPSTYRNIGRVRTTGIEAALNFQVFKNVFLMANYTLNDPQIKSDANREIVGNELSFRGADILNVGISYEIPTGLFVGVFLHNVSDRFTNNTNTETLAAYTTVDLKLRVPIGDRLAVNASWDNIFNQQFQEFPGWPGLGSNARIGLHFNF